MASRSNAADPPQWRLAGRPLPSPEFLQPTLDPDLPAYRSCPVAGTLTGSAPSILPDLVRRWLAQLATHQPRLRVDVSPPYGEPQAAGNERLRMFLEGRLDFAFLTRDMSSSDVAEFRHAHGFDPVSIPVGGGSYRHFGFVDSMAVIVNRDNPVTRLSLAELDAIFSKSRHRGAARTASTWGDVGVAEWSGEPIHIVGHGAWAGEESARATFFRRRVMEVDARPAAWRDDLGAADAGDAIVPEQVAADRYAIGFTGMGHLQPGTKTIALAASAAGPYFEATYENVAHGDFALARVFYIVVAIKPGAAPPLALCELIRFLLSRDGQRIVLEQGVFIPLRGWQVARSREMLGTCACGR